MSAPRKLVQANWEKNPVWSKASHRASTDLHAGGGNKICGAEVKGIVGLTQVKGLSPEISYIVRGQRFHILEASNEARVRGERVETYRGLRPRQVIEQFASGLGRALLLSKSSQQAAKARREYGSKAVGPTRSRGVTGVMPSDLGRTRT